MDLQVNGADSIRRLAADLKAFDDRKVILRELKKEIRGPVPKIRAAVREAAIRVLPSGNGLGTWVSKSRVVASIRISGSRRAGVSLRGGRNSQKKRSDVNAIDRGKVRAPSWGHRTAASWHSQSVTEGFFTKTVAEDHLSDWQDAVTTAVEKAVTTLGERS